MLGKGRLQSKQEIRQEIEEVLNGPYFGKTNKMFLTPKGKKTKLTQWIKQGEDYYQIVSKVVKEPVNQRYYLGDFVFSWVVKNAQRDVEVLKEMREELN